MPAFERKQIHLVLENFDDVLTYSVGNEPNREVVIGPR
ncbi:R3H domain-containing nucleic acid-binding protein [Fructilactobacillus sanfranciscensis]|nr:R3H domain-containing nucleic acid-binding protein [Fructilactobacillus sanfranciscensis]